MRKIIQLEVSEDEAKFIVLSMYLATVIIYKDVTGIMMGATLVQNVYETLDPKRLCLIADAIDPTETINK